jgi:hypothetical protein
LGGLRTASQSSGIAKSGPVISTTRDNYQRGLHLALLAMCSPCLVDPVACNPASGWENGQVAKQASLV